MINTYHMSGMLFGPATEWDKLPEDTLEVLVSNGVGEAAWQRMQQIDRMQQTRFGARAPGSRLYQALKGIGLSGIAATGILKAFAINNERREVQGKKKRLRDAEDKDEATRFDKFHKSAGESFEILR